MMSSSIGKRALVTSTVIAAFVGSGLAAAPEASAATVGSSVLTEAERHLGAPYVHGATGTNKFDCSGLVYYSRFKTTNRSKHSWFSTARAQYNHTTRISSRSRRPGDLVFFGMGTSYTGDDHVGIYLGWEYKGRSGGWIVNANAGHYRGYKVVIAPISEYGHVSGYGRM